MVEVHSHPKMWADHLGGVELLLLNMNQTALHCFPWGPMVWTHYAQITGPLNSVTGHHSSHWGSLCQCRTEHFTITCFQTLTGDWDKCARLLRCRHVRQLTGGKRRFHTSRHALMSAGIFFFSLSLFASPTLSPLMCVYTRRHFSSGLSSISGANAMKWWRNSACVKWRIRADGGRPRAHMFIPLWFHFSNVK